MGGKKSEFIYLFGFSLLTLFNIYLSVQCEKNNLSAYQTIFFSLFVIERILKLIIMVSKTEGMFLFYFLDLFLLGWTLGLSGYHNEQMIRDYVGISWLMLFPLVIAQLVIFFGNDLILQESLLDSYTPLLLYISFILSLTMLSVVVKHIKYQERFIFFKDILLPIMFSGILLATLFIFKGPLDIKVGYYALAIELVAIVFFVKAIPQYSLKNDDIFIFVIGTVIQTQIYNYGDSFYQKVRYFKLEEYFNQYGRYILSILFGISFILFPKLNSSPIVQGEMIYLANRLLSLIIGLVYISITIQDFYYQLCCIKVISFKSNHLNVKSITQVPSKKGALKKLVINFESYVNANIGSRSTHYDKNYKNCEQCLHIQAITKKVQLFQREGVEIDCTTALEICENHFIEMAGQIEKLFNFVYYFFPDGIISKIIAKKIVLLRYSNGFFCNSENTINTQLISEWDDTERSELNHLISTSLQIFLFYYKLSSHMPLSYSQVLYDLYEV